MSGLQSIHYQPSYKKWKLKKNGTKTSIANEFYIPSMKNADKYDRAVGFFRSSVFMISWSGLKSFIKNQGKIRILSSYQVSQKDFNALIEGYNERTNKIFDRIENELNELLSSNTLIVKATKLLASLVKEGIIEYRIIFIDDDGSALSKKIYHDKAGIFSDKFGNKVVFKGSMNETFMGLSDDGHLESIDVYTNWEGEKDKIRVENEVNDFELLWENNYNRIQTYSIKDVLGSKLLTLSIEKSHDKLIDEIIEELELSNSKKSKLENMDIIYTPFDHQREAINKWKSNNRRGIFKHITGAGKTFTSLLIIKEALQYNEIPLIIVPSKLLINQWELEIRKFFSGFDIKLLKCYSEENWKDNLSLWSTIDTNQDFRIILSTIQTAATQTFQNSLIHSKKLFVICDEVHRAGANQYSNIMNIKSGPRLGLSATPERYGDLEGTQKIRNYFGKIVHKFGLKEAIENRILSKYEYKTFIVKLSKQDTIKWIEHMNTIKQYYGILSSNNLGKEKIQSYKYKLKSKLINRAKISKTAKQKLTKCYEIIERNFKPGEKWLIYCDNLDQLNELYQNLETLNLRLYKYHYNMNSKSEDLLNVFSSQGGIILAIECLDEGVDIPSVSNAIIIASSTNPRQFIQRRGRILRQAPNKIIAKIYDFITLPDIGDSDLEKEDFKSLISTELRRSEEFAQFAVNKTESFSFINRLKIDFNLILETIQNEDYEYD